MHILIQFYIVVLTLVTSVVFSKAGEWTQDADVIVETKYGKIQGTTTLATNQKIVYSFKGIPFAKPPKRFEAPLPLILEEDRWEDEIRDGTKNPPSCAQWLTNLSPASEDCLYLNIYTPIKPGTSDVKLPVMFYIHGGTNIYGDTVLYGPHRLMAHADVVLVVIQYRVGALGFFSTDDYVVPGNNGLKDQRQALRWVQENIDAFNGDKLHVTLFGESAGASASLSHLLSPTTTGLFHKVIAQSGTPIAAWAKDPEPRKSAERYAASVNCTRPTTQAMVDCMKDLPWQILAKASLENFVINTNEQHLVADFGALSLVVEDEHEGAFLTRDPLQILKDGDYPHIPVILGANQHEGSGILGNAYMRNLGPSGNLENPSFVRHELVPMLLNAVGLGDESVGSPTSQSLADYYFPADAQKDNFTQITDGIVNLLSVLFFKAPILLTADYLSQNSNEIYLYSLEHEGFNSIWHLLVDLVSALSGDDPPPVKHGVTHADDLIYFWTLPFFITGKDRSFSEMICKMWTDFAVTSNPTSENHLPKWKPYSTKKPNYYKLDAHPEPLLDYIKNWRKGSRNVE